MFFTHIGRVIAFLVLALAIFQIALGFMIANEVLGPSQEMLARYSTAKTSGQIFDRSFYMIIGSVVLGILTEIAYALRAIKNSQATVGAPSASSV